MIAPGRGNSTLMNALAVEPERGRPLIERLAATAVQTPEAENHSETGAKLASFALSRYEVSNVMGPV
jgi:hypothetical protein